ncbi:hypothetical protein G5S34_17245 [Herbaspirillum frisingense]|uniref:hypothetical protein n=1 Tax=Herbaspirillum frisingense TaxID=92645 RepID=UPI0016007873|nr:hypothetical protein [Herbaspirillum frisingense]QNB08326.1 hypothetical protein G5S34_17245 [Herbaspirillum frisingense]
MGANQFLPFGTGGGANVIDQATYSALDARTAGFSAGTAESAKLNKVWRQSSIIAAMIGQIIADYSGADANDDGDISTLEAQFVAALRTVSIAVQGSFRRLSGSASGNSSIITYACDELVTGDGTGLVQVTRGWAGTINLATVGAGGLDAGTVAASTWYYAFGITKTDGTKAFLASLSATAPTLPAGYTKWARIGSFRTDPTANKYPLRFTQYGRQIDYNPAVGTNLTSYPQVQSGVTVTAGVDVSLTGAVPPTAAGARVIVTTGGTTNASIAGGKNGQDTSSNTTGVISAYASATVAVKSTGMIYFSTAQQIHVSSANDSNNSTLIVGWEENL